MKTINFSSQASCKGQISIEMFVAMGIILFLFLTFILLGIEKESQVSTRSELMGKRDVCISIQNAVGAVSSGGSGMQYDFEVSSGEVIMIVDNSVWVGDTNEYSCSLPLSINKTVTLYDGTLRVTSNGNNITIKNI